MELLLLYSFLLLILLLFSSQPQGLASTAAQGGRGMHYQVKEPGAEKVVGAAAAMSSAVMIGSRPPRCEGRCALCGRCEAVQVPVAPRDKGGHFRLAGAFGDGGDDQGSTNYKPLNWKCRCADRRVLNP